MQVELKTITPEYAEQLLRGNTHNRKFKKSALERYSKEIRSGKWAVNGDSIKVDKDGVLLDGQHRLRAVSQTGIPIKALVVEGLEPEVFNTLDQGARRSPADLLGIEGYTDRNVLAGALRLVMTDEAEGLTGNRLGDFAGHEYTEAIKEHPQLPDAVRKIGMKGLKGILPPTVLAYCFYRLAEIDQDECEEFFRKLGSGAGLERGSPILALREKMLRDRELIAIRKMEAIDMLFKAWNAWRKGEAISYMKWTDAKSPRKPK